MSWYQWKNEDLELSLKVQPRASKSEFIGLEADGKNYCVRLQAPPIDGRANSALCLFIAKAFGVALSKVTLLSGAQSRYKRVRICAPRTFPTLPDETVIQQKRS